MKESFSNSPRERALIAVVALLASTVLMGGVFSLFAGGSGGVAPADALVAAEPMAAHVARAAAPAADRPAARGVGPPRRDR